MTPEQKRVAQAFIRRRVGLPDDLVVDDERILAEFKAAIKSKTVNLFPESLSVEQDEAMTAYLISLPVGWSQ